MVKVQDIKTIAHDGGLTIPALVVDGGVKVTGKLPSAEEIKRWIS